MTAVLYILMRNDLDSMNAGKGMAQASHASNAFVALAQESNTPGFDEWESSTEQNFGTVLVLAASMPEIVEAVSVMRKFEYLAEIIHDPTYPIVDGKVVHHIPLDTCGYVFVPNKEEDEIARFVLGRFSLHP